MSDARAAILESIRTALGRGPLDEAARAAVDERMSTPPDWPRPEVEDERVARFTEKLAAVHGTCAQIERLDQLPEAVLAYLEHHGIEPKIIVAPALRDVPWPPPLQATFGASRGADAVSVTPCLAGVAETGTLALLSGPDSPTTLNFLPDDHIVVLRRERLLRHLEELWPLVRQHQDGAPRTVNLISGPSKTADVEQTIQYGAHGPRRLHVIIVSDAEPSS